MRQLAKWGLQEQHVFLRMYAGPPSTLFVLVDQPGEVTEGDRRQQREALGMTLAQAAKGFQNSRMVCLALGMVQTQGLVGQTS